MSTWVDTEQEQLVYKDGKDEYSEESSHDEGDDYDADSGMWEDGKIVSTYEQGEDGSMYEVVKQIREREVDRELTAIDLRSRFKRFGKATGDQSAMVTAEQPVALEMGAADNFERESRAEVDKLVKDAASADVSSENRRFAVLCKKLEVLNAALKQDLPTTEVESKDVTWGARRGARTHTDSTDDHDRRIRVTNLSDYVTEDNLREIFCANGGVVEKVFLPKDKETGKSRGYAFVTFRDAWMIEEPLHRRRYKFKNLVMNVSKAIKRND